MIHEFRTYELKQGQVPEYQKRFADKLQGRLEFSPLGGHWYSEVGPLNQVIALWPYENMEQRAVIRSEAESTGQWNPGTSDLVINVKSELYVPAPFMKPLEPREIGPIYEMRLYTYLPEHILDVVQIWSELIVAREKLSPLAGCWYSEWGGMDNFVHLWAYETFEQRLEKRAVAIETGAWPPPGHKPFHQETKLLLPSSFSPMQ